MPLNRILLVLLVLPITGAAQQRALRQGDRCMAEARVTDAIAHYERAAATGAPDSVVASRLAHGYLSLRSLPEAERWFAKAAASPNATARTLLLYANTQRASGRYDEADRTMLRYAMLANAQQRTRWSTADAEGFRALATEGSCRCTVQGLPINTPGTEISPVLLDNRLVFASDRGGSGTGTWNGAPYLDLFEAELRGGRPGSPIAISALNTRYHESSATFSPDGAEVWFDRNNFHAGQKGRNAQGVMEMRIYGRTRTAGNWLAEAPFAHNGDQGSTCHPRLSPAGDLLFFASDRPGGHGGSDIWYTARDGAGQWKAPVCLGPEVNTEGDEGFPFLSAQGELYFASDGHPGLGGLDILRIAFDGSKATGKAVNPGAPLNGPADDFGIVLDRIGATGYFVSNRSGGAGGDDLYAVSFPEPLVGAVGIARDRLSARLLPGTRVLLADAHGNPLDSTVVDSAGAYRLSVRRGMEQQLSFSLTDYRTLTYTLETPADADTVYRINPPMAFLRTVGMWMHVTDSHTGDGIEGADVHVIDVANEGRTLISNRTDRQGDHRSRIRDVSIADSLVYRVKLSRTGYYPKKGLFLYVVPDSGEIAMHHVMDISMEPIAVGTDAGKLLELAPILFATGRSEILPEAASELDKIIELLEGNPTLRIELRGHTDSRGSATTNRALSARRAQSAADYIVRNGIPASRIRSRGYGESALLNGCGDGKPCTEEQHAANRRTEFIVIGK